MKSLMFSIVLVVVLNTGLVKGQGANEISTAESYFNELSSLCNLDNRSLWGINLYGATMFVFPDSRIIIANEPDNKGVLVKKENLYIGKLPEDFNIANTSFQWNGKNWTMINWDAIPETDKYSRGKLLIHESWHRNQKEIGILPVMTANTHLDEFQGSILLKLEFIALSHALKAEEEADKTNHLYNALIIRQYRHSLFPGNNEDLFELHEGMAEYTGLKLCGIDKKLLPAVAAKQLEMAMDKEGFANSFAYLTGPAYGVLFDELSDSWINNVKTGTVLPVIGSQIVDKNISCDTLQLKDNVANLITQYEAEELIKKETGKFENQKQLADFYSNRFLKEDVLIIKNNNIQFSFNPQEKLIPVENGVVYRTMRLVGEWGIAEIKNGIFRSNDWQIFLLPAPVSGMEGSTINEEDYTLYLNDGWKVTKIKDGKFTLIKN